MKHLYRVLLALLCLAGASYAHAQSQTCIGERRTITTQ